MCSIVTAGAGDFAAGVCAGSAKVEALDRRGVAAPTSHWSEVEVLFGNNVEVTDVAIGQPHSALEIGRGE